MSDIRAVVDALYDSAEMLRCNIPGATGEQHDAWVMRSIAAREAIPRIERVLEAAKAWAVEQRENGNRQTNAECDLSVAVKELAQ